MTCEHETGLLYGAHGYAGRRLLVRGQASATHLERVISAGTKLLESVFVRRACALFPHESEHLNLLHQTVAHSQLPQGCFHFHPQVSMVVVGFSTALPLFFLLCGCFCEPYRIRPNVRRTRGNRALVFASTTHKDTTSEPALLHKRHKPLHTNESG